MVIRVPTLNRPKEDRVMKSIAIVIATIITIALGLGLGLGLGIDATTMAAVAAAACLGITTFPYPPREMVARVRAADTGIHVEGRPRLSAALTLSWRRALCRESAAGGSMGTGKSSTRWRAWTKCWDHNCSIGGDWKSLILDPIGGIGKWGRPETDTAEWGFRGENSGTIIKLYGLDDSPLPWGIVMEGQVWYPQFERGSYSDHEIPAILTGQEAQKNLRLGGDTSGLYRRYDWPVLPLVTPPIRDGVLKGMGKYVKVDRGYGGPLTPGYYRVVRETERMRFVALQESVSITPTIEG